MSTSSAGTFRRGVAFLLDCYFTLMLNELIMAAVSMLCSGETYWTDLGVLFADNIAPSAFFLTAALSLAVCLLYHCMVPLIGLKRENAATFGQRLMKLCVVSSSGAPVRPSRLLKRNGLCFVLLQVSVTSAYVPLRTLMELHLPSIVPIVLFAASLIAAIASLLMLLFGGQHLTLHDRLSGTCLIQRPVAAPIPESTKPRETR